MDLRICVKVMRTQLGPRGSAVGVGPEISSLGPKRKKVAQCGRRFVLTFVERDNNGRNNQSSLNTWHHKLHNIN